MVCLYTIWYIDDARSLIGIIIKIASLSILDKKRKWHNAIAETKETSPPRLPIWWFKKNVSEKDLVKLQTYQGVSLNPN